METSLDTAYSLVERPSSSLDTVPLLQPSSEDVSSLDQKIAHNDSVSHLNEEHIQSSTSAPIKAATLLEQFSSALSRLASMVVTVASSFFKALVAGAKFVYNLTQKTPVIDQTQNIQNAVLPFLDQTQNIQNAVLPFTERAEAIGMQPEEIEKLKQTLTHGYQALGKSISLDEARPAQLPTKAREALMKLLETEITQLKAQDPPDEKQIKAKTVEYRLLSQTFPTELTAPNLQSPSMRVSEPINTPLPIKQQIEAHVDHMLEKAYNHNPQLALPRDTRHDLIQGFQKAYSKNPNSFDPKEVRAYELTSKARLALLKVLSPIAEGDISKKTALEKAQLSVLAADFSNPYNDVKLHFDINGNQFEDKAREQSEKLLKLIQSAPSSDQTDQISAYQTSRTTYAKEQKESIKQKLDELNNEIKTFHRSWTKSPSKAILILLKAKALEFEYIKHNEYYLKNGLSEFSDDPPIFDEVSLLKVATDLVSKFDFSMKKNSHLQIQELHALATLYNNVKPKDEYGNTVYSTQNNKDRQIDSFMLNVESKSSEYKTKWLSSLAEDGVNSLLELKSTPPAFMSENEFQELVDKKALKIEKDSLNAINALKEQKKEIEFSSMGEELIEADVQKIQANINKINELLKQVADDITRAKNR